MDFLQQLRTIISIEHITGSGSCFCWLYFYLIVWRHIVKMKVNICIYLVEYSFLCNWYKNY